MSFKNNAAIVAAAAGVAFASMSLVEPHLPNQPTRTPAQIQQDRRDQGVSDLSDVDENQKGRHRDDGNDLQDANNRDKLRAGERRPPTPDLPRFRYLPK